MKFFQVLMLSVVVLSLIGVLAEERGRYRYEKARKGLLNHERAFEDFLEHDFR